MTAILCIGLLTPMVGMLVIGKLAMDDILAIPKAFVEQARYGSWSDDEKIELIRSRIESIPEVRSASLEEPEDTLPEIQRIRFTVDSPLPNRELERQISRVCSKGELWGFLDEFPASCHVESSG